MEKLCKVSCVLWMRNTAEEPTFSIRVFFVGSLVLSGGASLALKAGSAASKMMAVTRVARMRGLVTLQSARILSVSAGVLDTKMMATALDRSCGGTSSRPQMRQSGDCKMAPKIEDISKDSCYLEVALASPGFAALGLNLSKYGRRAVSTVNRATPNTSVAANP